MVVACDTFYGRHEQLVVVDCQIGFLKDGCQFKLIGCHFVMPCLDGNAQTVAHVFQFVHECIDPFGDGAEIMVFELLVFCSGMSHQGTSAELQIGAGIVKGQVDEEVFLFPAERGNDFLHVFVEVLAAVYGCFVNERQCFE